MIASDFNSLQAARSHRNSEDIANWFRAMNEAQQMAQMEESARQNDMVLNDRAADRHYARGMDARNFAFKVAADAQNQAQDNRRLDIDEKRYAENVAFMRDRDKRILDNEGSTNRRVLFRDLYNGVVNGSIPDETTLDKLGGSTLEPDQRSALGMLFTRGEDQRKAQLFAEAKGLESQFQASNPPVPIDRTKFPMDKLQEDYFTQTGLPAGDTQEAVDVVRGMPARHGAFGSMATAAIPVVGPAVALGRYFTQGGSRNVSDADLAGIEAQAKANEDMRKRAFSKFVTDNIMKQGLPFAPNPDTYSLQPTEAPVANYFAQTRGAPTATPVAVQPSPARLTVEQATMLLREAGGDKAAARALARQRGYSF